MKKVVLSAAAVMLAGFFANATAGDVAAGKAKAATCAGCHGANGISNVPMYPNLAGQKAAYTAKQLKAFLESTRDDRLTLLWLVLPMTGMRRGEVCGLRWEDVDLERGRLSVRRALIPHGDGVITSEPKTA